MPPKCYRSTYIHCKICTLLVSVAERKGNPKCWGLRTGRIGASVPASCGAEEDMARLQAVPLQVISQGLDLMKFVDFDPLCAIAKRVAYSVVLSVDDSHVFLRIPPLSNADDPSFYQEAADSFFCYCKIVLRSPVKA